MAHTSKQVSDAKMEMIHGQEVKCAQVHCDKQKKKTQKKPHALKLYIYVKI